MLRVNVFLPHDVAAVAAQYTAEGSPAGALYRVLAEWALALCEEAPYLEADEAETLIRFLDAEGAGVTPLRQRHHEGVLALVESLPTRLYEDALFSGLDEAVVARLTLKLASMHPLARLGVLMKAAWAREVRDGKRSAKRHPREEAEAIALSRLVAPDLEKPKRRRREHASRS